MKPQRVVARAAALALVISLVAPVTAGSPAFANPAGAGRSDTVESAWSPTGRTASSGTPAARAALASSLRTATDTIPFWSSSFNASGTTYPFMMVGSPPGQPHETRVPTVLVPIDLTFESFGPNVDPHVDGSTRVATILDSPIFQTATYTATGDATQFADAVSRAEWAGVMKNLSHYHVLLDLPTVAPVVKITVPANLGQVFDPGDGIPRASVDRAWWDQVIPGLVAQLGISPEVLPIFVTADTGAGLAAGFHGAFQAQTGAHQSSIWTYVWASWFDPGWFSIFGLPPAVGADVDVFSHEVTEWVNDPFLNNIVPPWSFSAPPVIVNACSNLLEVGDPLEETPFTVSLNGTIYHLQDEAFFSYFARQSPSIGFHGRYSFLGTLSSFSSPCPSP